LGVGRGEHAVVQLMFESSDLGLQERVLLGVQRRLEPRQLRERRRRLDVVFLEQGADAALAPEGPAHEEEPGPQEIAGLPLFRADHVCLRNQVDPQQLRERGRIDGIGLHLRIADGLEILGVTEPEINPLGHQEIPEPVPHPRAFHHGPVRSRERPEVGGQRPALRGQGSRANDRPRGIEGMDGDRALVQIDSGEQHGTSQRVIPTTMLSLGLVGNISVCSWQRSCGTRGGVRFALVHRAPVFDPLQLKRIR
jgi:hypothetical protein